MVSRHDLRLALRVDLDKELVTKPTIPRAEVVG